MVDGILASCYPSTDHDMAHLGMAPMRWIPEIIKCIFGNDPGFPSYVNIARKLGTWIIPLEQEKYYG